VIFSPKSGIIHIVDTDNIYLARFFLSGDGYADFISGRELSFVSQKGEV
jgi:hypothetical protein